MECANKVILITGASSGIGRATALNFSKYNNKIAIVARRETMLKEVSKQIEANGSECIYFAGDALDENFAKETVDKVVSTFGRIDIAVLGIGIGPPSNTLTASCEKIKKCMAFNFETFINFYVPIMHQMLEQKDECIICNVNSLASYFGIPMQGDYTAAKGAIRLFIETARMELKHFGYKHIRLQTIHPGFVDTDAVRNDGIPAPNEISEDRAGQYIVNGIKKNKKENMFPFKTSIGVRLGRRFLPKWLVTKAVLSETPKNY